MRRYPVTSLCALAGVTRQAFYKRVVVQYVVKIREQDPKIGADKLWRMYSSEFPEEYRVGRDIFRCILHERGLNIVQHKRTARTTDSRHSLPTYPNQAKVLSQPQAVAESRD